MHSTSGAPAQPHAPGVAAGAANVHECRLFEGVGLGRTLKLMPSMELGTSAATLGQATLGLQQMFISRMPDITRGNAAHSELMPSRELGTSAAMLTGRARSPSAGAAPPVQPCLCASASDSSTA